MKALQTTLFVALQQSTPQLSWPPLSALNHSTVPTLLSQKTTAAKWTSVASLQAFLQTLQLVCLSCSQIAHSDEPVTLSGLQTCWKHLQYADFMPFVALIN